MRLALRLACFAYLSIFYLQPDVAAGGFKSGAESRTRRHNTATRRSAAIRDADGAAHKATPYQPRRKDDRTLGRPSESRVSG